MKKLKDFGKYFKKNCIYRSHDTMEVIGISDSSPSIVFKYNCPSGLRSFYCPLNQEQWEMFQERMPEKITVSFVRNMVSIDDIKLETWSY